MKRYVWMNIGVIFFGIISAFCLEAIQHWFLLGIVAIYCSSLFVLFAQSKKEAMVLYWIFSTSFFLSRMFLTYHELASMFYFIIVSGIACVSILYCCRPGAKMNALRSFVALVYILVLINQPKSVFYIGLFVGGLTYVNMSLQADRTDFFKVYPLKELQSHRNFQERIAARNRLTTNLVVQSVCAEYNKLEKRQFDQKMHLL